MLITHLELDNFKSYAHAEIPFQPGTNAILGANGAGKSTLIEAIGLVLFNHVEEGLNQGTLVREGETSGRVVVRIIACDGREYEVERQLNSRTTTRYCVYDRELGSRLVEGVRDVQAWLNENLGLREMAVGLSTLFRNTIGVPQGTFTAPFLEASTTRKSIFDPLLQVEQYKKASDNLLETARVLDKQLGELRIQLARMQGELAHLPALQAEQADLERDIASLQLDLQALQAEGHQIANELQVLDEAERRTRDLALRVAQAQGEHERQQALLENAQRQLDEAEEATRKVALAETGHAAYLAAERYVQQLEQQRAQRDVLSQEQARQETERARLTTRIQQLTDALAEVAAARERLGALVPLVEQQRALEAEIAQAEGQVRDLAAACRREQETAAEVIQARTAQQCAQQEAQQAANLDQALLTIEARLYGTTQAANETREQRATTLAESERLQKQSLALAGAEQADATARCPVCESELTPAHRDELLARNTQRQQDLQAEASALEDKLKRLTREVQALEAERKRSEQRRRSLASAEMAQRAQEMLTTRVATWEQAQAEVAALQGAPSRLEVARQALQALGDPRREYQTCEDCVGRGPTHERGLGQMRTQESRLATELNQRATELAAFSHLDSALHQAQEQRAQHREAHYAWLTHSPVAQQVAPRRERVTQLAATAQVKCQTWSDLQAQHQQALCIYDGQHHERIRQRYTSNQERQAVARAQSEEKSRRLQATRHEMERLQGLEGECQRKQAEEQELQQLAHTVNMVRDLLKRAGPQINRQRVRQISRIASTYYADIMSDPTAFLQWSEDYDLTLEVRGLKRAFRQLSGGEQMAAALALRLALLRQIGDLKIAFFDEPTAHLDPERREGLVQKIMQIQGFEQLFIISHDDTFEQAAQSHIRIVKDHNGSHVV